MNPHRVGTVHPLSRVTHTFTRVPHPLYRQEKPKAQKDDGLCCAAHRRPVGLQPELCPPWEECVLTDSKAGWLGGWAAGRLGGGLWGFGRGEMEVGGQEQGEAKWLVKLPVAEPELQSL